MEFQVECGKEIHRVVWDGKSLQPVDHDLEAERVVRVLGAKAPSCIEICDLDRLDWSGPRSLLSLFEQPSRKLDASAYDASLRQLERLGLSSYAELTRRAAIAARLESPVRHFLALRASSRVSFEQKEGDLPVIAAVEEAVRALLPERHVKVRCVITRDTKTPYVFGLRSKDSANVFVAVTPSWRRTVLEESAVVVDSHLVLRLNSATPHRRARSAQVVTWEGNEDLRWAEVKQASLTKSGDGLVIQS